ncbi:hypothetical protein L1987_08845 [Smallanthus sonchifolius]|uniref:Uncharacterized protein n=1 Tax=Smallanthus sonchifolius TaxID=185202 RepID=A0ACB9JNJ7_9ASTR|nr:hypothetical protein L1987_08845 [Smallanthus sonchifolius]
MRTGTAGSKSVVVVVTDSVWAVEGETGSDERWPWTTSRVAMVERVCSGERLGYGVRWRLWWRPMADDERNLTGLGGYDGVLTRRRVWLGGVGHSYEAVMAARHVRVSCVLS